MAAKRPDEGCSRERQRLTLLEHPSSVSALRADPPSPTRGEGEGRARVHLPIAFSGGNRPANFRQIACEPKTSTRNFAAISASWRLRAALFSRADGPGGRPWPGPANWHWSGRADVQISHRQHWRM
ncbi:hypothetical protein FJ425_19045 [Mesorhizobium sp. B2-7-2]|nr:hypothetical protein FJ425_19045 [Mesorhizobium sp. B2-7-2]